MTITTIDDAVAAESAALVCTLEDFVRASAGTLSHEEITRQQSLAQFLRVEATNAVTHTTQPTIRRSPVRRDRSSA